MIKFKDIRRITEEVIIEAKRKKFLGQIRGKTDTGERAHAIDLKPQIDLKVKIPQRK